MEQPQGQPDYLRWQPDKYFLQPYLPQGGGRRPFALICPGGGYHVVCGGHEGRAYAEALNARGYAAFVLCYRCGERFPYPVPQQDAARALREILARAEEWGLETGGYSLWGSSAGGHLAASLCTESMGAACRGLPRPAALVLAYPVITMGEKGHAGSRENLLGPRPTKEQIARASIERQAAPGFPPTFVWCGSADRTVDPANSRMLAGALQAQGVPCRLREYPGIDHGVGLGQGLACEGWFSEAVSFWEEARARGTASGR